MLHRPKFRSVYTVAHVAGEGLFLLSEQGHHVLKGESVSAIAPFLTGQFTLGEIFAALSGNVPPSQIEADLQLLFLNGHIEEGAKDENEYSTYISALGNPFANESSNNLYNIINLSHSGAEHLDRQLRLAGFHPHFEGIPIVLCSDYLDVRLEAINAEQLRRRQPWLLAKPDGLTGWIGPVFHPASGACLACLQQWISRNREVENHIGRQLNLPGPVLLTQPSIPAVASTVLSSIALVCVQWFGANLHNLHGKLKAFDSIAGEFSDHMILRRPQCPSCGNPAITVGAAQIERLKAQPTLNTDGGFRSKSPADILVQFQKFVSPISGVISGVVPSKWNDRSPIRTYSAGHNFALSNKHLAFLTEGLRTCSSGKGTTDTQARASAICEALERYSGVFQGNEARVRSSKAELGARALDPNECMLFSDRQFEERQNWNERGLRFQVVPQPMPPNASIEWSAVYPLTGGDEAYLPTSYLYFGYPTEEDAFYAWADSNGNAAGATIEDALLQALLELIERDAVSIWWYNRLQMPGVDLSELGDAYVNDVVSFLDDLGRDVWVLDLTHDLEIPTYAALTRRRAGAAEDIVFGFGSHLSAKVAIRRAVTEMCQFAPAVLESHSDGSTNYMFNDAESLRWWTEARITTHPYLTPSGEAPRKHESTEYSVATALSEILSRLRQKNLQVFYLDQTRPEVGLSVVKVICPGMRHWWARFAPGRLYDVPVVLDKLTQPRLETELNAVPLFI